MGNRTSRVVRCLVPSRNGKDGVDLEFLQPLDEGLGHSFCYVRPAIPESPAITPSDSERFALDSGSLDPGAVGGSFRQEIAEESSGTQRINKGPQETTFRAISGASVSANASAIRTGNPNILLLGDVQEPAASFESTASFAAIPLQPAPHGSGPLNGFLSGPIERGFASGPLERGGSFTSGPLERGAFLSGPLDSMDRSNFSAPISCSKKREGFGNLVKNVSRPMRSALSRGPSWVQRFLLQPMSQFVWQNRDARPRSEAPRVCSDVGPSENECRPTSKLQWAHGKAGEDRVHVVLSEEQGWLYVGIYDGFSGPDAPDFLTNNLYRTIDKELEGLLWEYDKPGGSVPLSGFLATDGMGTSEDFATVLLLPVDDGEGRCGEEAVSAAKNDNENNMQCDANKYPGDESVKLDEITGSKSEIVGTGQVKVVSLTSENGEIDVCARITDDYDSINEPINRSVEALPISDTKDEAKTVLPKEAIVACKEDERNVYVKYIGMSNDLRDELAPSNEILGKDKKRMRLYELLQIELMEEMDGKISSSMSDAESRRTGPDKSCPCVCEKLTSRQHSIGEQPVPCLMGMAQDCSLHMGDAVGSRGNEGAAGEEAKDDIQKVMVSGFTPGRKQIIKRSLIGSKMKEMKRKQKILRRKLFPWSYDWHREQTHLDDKVLDSSVVIRRCKLGPVDHNAVLKAMSHALQTTEEAYMNMVRRTLDSNPELALMGSCVLVMLMKDQDVYVMNLGDSRVVLAQERLNNWHISPNMAKEGSWNRSRESHVRVELDRISEESPMQNPSSGICKINKDREISMYKLSMRAIQLSRDHSTDIEEEVQRIKAEHADDMQSVFNDRVKGQLKVTRAFGAGFLKQPEFNEALLEMFRINYIGTSPYLSCIPSIVHHRLCSNDRFLVLSSDGLYQYFSNEEVVSHVAWFMDNVPGGDPAQYLITELLYRAAKKNGMDFRELLDIPHGDRRKYHDDVSVMVVSLEGGIWRSSG